VSYIAKIDTVLESVKAATEIVDFLKDSNLSLDDADKKLKLASLISLLCGYETGIIRSQAIPD